MENSFFVKLRGLPWSCTKQQIIEFFEPIKIKGDESGIHMATGNNGRPSGEAYVEFASEEDISAAEDKNEEHIGRRYIEVYRAKRDDLKWFLRREHGSRGENTDDCVVRLRGLPYECSKEEISNFFSGLEIVPNGIALEHDLNGRSTGEAYVQFLTSNTASRALQKHKEKIGHRYIEVFNSTLDAIQSVNRCSDNIRRQGPGDGPYNRPSPFNRGGPPGPFGDMRGGGMGPFRDDMRGMGPFNSSNMAGPNFSTGGNGFSNGGGRNGGFNNNPPFNNGNGAGFDNIGSLFKTLRDNFNAFAGGFNNMNDDRGVWMDNGGGSGGFNSHNSRSAPYNARERMGGSNRFGNRGGNMRERIRDDRGRSGGMRSNDNGGETYSIHMRGLPFKAKEKDIDEFFAPLEVVSINMTSDNMGRPSGEADVEFASRQEALRAMEKHKGQMWHRYIELFMNNSRSGSRY